MNEKTEKWVLISSVSAAVLFLLILLFIKRDELALPERQGGSEAGSATVSGSQVTDPGSVSDNGVDMTEAGFIVSANIDPALYAGNEELQNEIAGINSSYKESNIYLVWDSDIENANIMRADYHIDFVMSEPADDKKGKDKAAVIEYNDDYYIPDYDSKTLASRLKGAYEAAGYESSISYVEDEGLKDAMQPAVRVVLTGYDKEMIGPAMRAVLGETEGS